MFAALVLAPAGEAATKTRNAIAASNRASTNRFHRDRTERPRRDCAYAIAVDRLLQRKSRFNPNVGRRKDPGHPGENGRGHLGTAEPL